MIRGLPILRIGSLIVGATWHLNVGQVEVCSPEEYRLCSTSRGTFAVWSACMRVYALCSMHLVTQLCIVLALFFVAVFVLYIFLYISVLLAPLGARPLGKAVYGAWFPIGSSVPFGGG